MEHTCGFIEWGQPADSYRKGTRLAQKYSIRIHDAAALIVVE
jgi:hypothetical protein